MATLTQEEKDFIDELMALSEGYEDEEGDEDDENDDEE